MGTQTVPGIGLPSARLPLWPVPTFFTGVLAFLAVAAVIALRPGRSVRELEHDLARLRSALEHPGVLVQQHVDLGESVLARIEAEPQKTGEAYFLLGSVYTRLGEQAPGMAGDECRLKALEHLQKAEALGVPAGDLPRLQFRIGTLLFHFGKDYPRTIDYLSRSIAQGAEDPAAGYDLLTTAELRLQPPDLDAALKANQKELDAISIEDAAAAVRLRRAEILLNKNLRLEAIKVLERIGPTAPPRVRQTARFLQARCCFEEGLWNKAVPLWKEVLANPLPLATNRARLLLVLGESARKLDPPDDALATSSWQEAEKAGGIEGQAASLYLAKLHLADPETALADFARALENVGTPGDYDNPLIDLTSVRQLLEEGCRTFREARAYEQAQLLAELYQKLALPGQAQERYAEISEAWAQDLEEQAKKTEPAERARLEAQVRAGFAQAGAAYEKAMSLRPAAEKAELAWRSATCFARAEQPIRALPVLEDLVKMPTKPERQAESWFALGQAHKAVGHTEQARQAFYKSLELPTSPVASRARLELASTEIDQKNFDQAEAILQQNLRVTGATPDREAHEKSLYHLGLLLYQRGDYLKASVLLKEAVRQYPKNPDAQAARARLASSYVKLAQEAKQKLQSKESYADVQAHLVRSRREWLEQALEIYQKLAEHLDRSGSAPTATDSVLQTEAFFAAAQCKFDLEEAREAFRLYRLLFERYRHRIPGLQAVVKMYMCYQVLPVAEKLEVLPELRATVNLALEELPTMPAELFEAPQALKRENWRSWLQNVQIYLARQAPVATSSDAGER
jgi:tetratricopeptide (TPR) repeat protein